MKVKIFYRSTTTWNIILHIMLSFMFVYLSSAVLISRSIFENSFLIEILRSKTYLLVSYALTVFFVYRLSNKSKTFYLISCSLTIANVALILFSDFSKLITLLLFLYIIVSYYLYNFLKTQLNQSFYNPSFKEDDLFTPMLKRFDCTIKSQDLELKGFLTNWSETGFYVYLEETEQKFKAKNLKGSKVYINFEEHVFDCEVTLVSMGKDNKSLGFKVKNYKEEDLSWFGFYQIIDKMGYQVELLK